MLKYSRQLQNRLCNFPVFFHHCATKFRKLQNTFCTFLVFFLTVCCANLGNLRLDAPPPPYKKFNFFFWLLLLFRGIHKHCTVQCIYCILYNVKYSTVCANYFFVTKRHCFKILNNVEQCCLIWIWPEVRKEFIIKYGECLRLLTFYIENTNLCF